MYNGMLPKSLEPYRHLIDMVSDERPLGGGYWIYLNIESDILEAMSGADDTIHEDTISECAKIIKLVFRNKTA